MVVRFDGGVGETATMGPQAAKSSQAESHADSASERASSTEVVAARIASSWTSSRERASLGWRSK
jgi:hypothetical protein